MESRIDIRKKDFKKSFEDPLRRRENEQIQIRKATREAQLSKKRMTVDLSQKDVNEDNRERLTAIPASVFDGLMDSNHERNLKAVQEVRHMLSQHSSPPIQLVIDSNLLPRLVQFLGPEYGSDLQFEAAWALTNIASGTAAQTRAVVDAGAIPYFIRLLHSEALSVKEQSVWALGNIAGDCVELRNAVIGAGAFEIILRELARGEVIAQRIFLMRYATWTLSNFCRGPWAAPYRVITESLPVVRQLLYANDPDIIADACWSISYMSDTNNGNNHPILDEIIRHGVCGRIVELLDHRSYLVQAPALRAVGNIVTGNDGHTQTMIAYGCVPKLKKLLSSTYKPIRKETCWALSNITAGNIGQIQEVIDQNVLPGIAKALATDEHEVRKEAAWCVANAASGGDVSQVAAIVKDGCLPPLVNVLDVNDLKIISIALEAIENILKCGKQKQEEEGLHENPFAVQLEEADAFPRLEKLQYLTGTSKIQSQAIRIMTEYLDAYVETEEPAVNPQAGAVFGGMS